MKIVYSAFRKKLQPGKGKHMSQVYDFLRGAGTNNRGQTLNQVLLQSTMDLAEDTGWEKWLFPLYEPNRGNCGVPLIEVTEIAEAKRNAVIRYNMRRSSGRMRTYFGNPHWLVTGEDLNHRRITRIISSLTLFQLDPEAREFYDFITGRIQGMDIPQVSIIRWRQAIGVL